LTARLCREQNSSQRMETIPSIRNKLLAQQPKTLDPPGANRSL
jgi:hypothetical protein